MLAKLEHLFTPLRIGRMEAANRIVMPGMDPGFGIDENGCVTEQLTAYLLEEARSGTGMIITGAMPVHPLGGSATMRMVHLWDDIVVPSLDEMVKAVHRHDVRFGGQVVHMGITHLPKPSVCSSVPPKAAQSGAAAREATKDDIREIVDAFGKSAERCVAAGFDFIEIHAAHAYLINEFLSPGFNRRTDEYGGSFENRIRFLLEVVRGTRRALAGRLALGVRIGGDDYVGEGGWNLTELCRLAPILEQEGVDYINVSQGGASYGSMHVNIAPYTRSRRIHTLQ